MMITSVTDPALLQAPEAFSGPTAGLLADHLMHMAHCHYMAMDREGSIGKAILTAIRKAPPQWAGWIQCVLAQADRMVPLSVTEGVHASEGEPPCNDSLTALALTVAREKGVEVAVVSPEGADAARGMQNTGCCISTLERYGLTEAKRREFTAMGSQSIGGMKEAQFLTSIVEPVVRWAAKVIIIDPWIGTSLFQGGHESNWPVFKNTLQSIYGCWEASCLDNRDSFEILTLPAIDRRDERRGSTIRIPSSRDEEASLIGTKLGLGDLTRVRLIDPRAVKDIKHDRYLVTNRNVTLSFSRGFDLIPALRDELRECAVSLYREADGQTIGRLLSARTVGLWPKPSQPPHFRVRLADLPNPFDDFVIRAC
ncbi:MAG: hypothetical protein FJ280_09640 [Planctomycetes bacterium]|nr:hypothetical protein [Planctomycetota bacterium]